MAAKETIGRWFNRASNAVGFWSLVPPGLVALVSAYLSTGVKWISAYGAWGWFMSGLVAFVLAAIGFSLIARTRIWRVEAKNRARTLGDSSPFDPMARIYENKRLYLRDLAPLGRRQVMNKAFVNCEIIGPGTAVLGLRRLESNPYPSFKDCLTHDVDCIEIDGSVASNLAVEFYDCDFTECRFFHMSLLWLDRSNESLHWITKDSRQALLTEQGEKSKTGLGEMIAALAGSKADDEDK